MAKRLHVVLACFGILAGVACSPESDMPGREKASALPDTFAIAAFRAQDCDGSRTRALVIADTSGNVTVNPMGSSPAYRVDMVSTLSSPTSGSMTPSYWCRGAVQVLVGQVSFSGYTFDSDPKYPLTFEMSSEKGFRYLCGRGTVRTPEAAETRLGYEQTAENWLPMLRSQNPVIRGAAAQALGYLAAEEEKSSQSVRVLEELLKDSSPSVRINAAEALARLHAQSAVAVARSLLETEKDEQVRDVLEYVIGKIEER